MARIRWICFCFFLLAITVSAVASCGFDSQRATDPREPDTTAFVPPTTTTQPRETPSASPTVMHAVALTTTPMPTTSSLVFTPPLADLLVNLSKVTLPSLNCVPESSSQIWLLKYPYSSADVLIADAKSNYYYPRWSPDGEWIAFVESEAATNVISSTELGVVKVGADSVWVMRADGTEKRRISTITRHDYYTPTECVITVNPHPNRATNFHPKRATFG